MKQILAFVSRLWLTLMLLAVTGAPVVMLGYACGGGDVLKLLSRVDRLGLEYVGAYLAFATSIAVLIAIVDALQSRRAVSD